MEIRIAGIADIDVAYGLILQARGFLKSCGVDQWQNEYPNRDNIVADIDNGTGVLLVADGRIEAYACVDFGGEPAYDTLQGTWLDDKPYAVIHRMAVSNESNGKGRAKAFFLAIEGFVRERGISSIRVDTDEDNAIMKHLLQVTGYTYCGTIWFDNSVKIAYQKQLLQ